VWGEVHGYFVVALALSVGIEQPRFGYICGDAARSQHDVFPFHY